jgi:hypothetical protein
MWQLIRWDMAYNRRRIIILYAVFIPLICISVSVGGPLQMIFFIIGFSLGLSGITMGVDERREYRIRLYHTLPIPNQLIWRLRFVFIGLYVTSLMLLTGLTRWIARPNEFSSLEIILIATKTLLLFIAAVGSYINYDLYFGVTKHINSGPARLVNWMVIGAALFFYFTGPQWEKMHRWTTGVIQTVSETGFLVICMVVLGAMIALDSRLYRRRKSYLR